jgi:MOSC domain-containing protein YiiM
MGGVVDSVWLAGEAGAALEDVSEALAIAGRGLAGDRYARGLGSFSRWPGGGRAVSLIEAEVIEAVAAGHGLDLSGGRSRRNIVTRGVRLNELVGKRFRVGGALFRADRLAQPCGYLERRVGPGLQAALRGRGGLRADVLEAGVIRPGDAVREE